MRSIARNEGDPKTMVVDQTILPPEFQEKDSRVQEIKLPPEALDWVVRERSRIKSQVKARALINTDKYVPVAERVRSLWLTYLSYQMTI